MINVTKNAVKIGFFCALLREFYRNVSVNGDFKAKEEVITAQAVGRTCEKVLRWQSILPENI